MVQALERTGRERIPPPCWSVSWSPAGCSGSLEVFAGFLVSWVFLPWDQGPRTFFPPRSFFACPCRGQPLPFWSLWPPRKLGPLEGLWIWLHSHFRGSGGPQWWWMWPCPWASSSAWRNRGADHAQTNSAPAASAWTGRVTSLHTLRDLHLLAEWPVVPYPSAVVRGNIRGAEHWAFHHDRQSSFYLRWRLEESDRLTVLENELFKVACEYS